MAESTGVQVKLEARGLGKAYDAGPSRVRRLARLLAGPGTDARDEPVWALSEVDFALRAGESLGVIGRNGAGKSTLLRLLAGTVQPSRGEIRRAGRHASLLDLGIGFHDLETGRENVLTALELQARLSREEARLRLAEVEAFAEVGEFFDRPIRCYSEGMRLRLAFATVTVLRPEVLITDEILVVGDQGFQERCQRWFEDFLAGGGSLVLCSHDLASVSALCQRTLWLEGGRAMELGPSDRVIRNYRTTLEGALGDPAGARHEAGETVNLPFEVVELHLLDGGGRDVCSLAPDEAAEVVVEIVARAAVPQVLVGITREDLTPVYGVASDMDAAVPEDLGEGRYRYRLRFDALPLAAGRYRLRAHALDETGTRLYDTVEFPFSMKGDEHEGGFARLPVPWRPAARP